MLETYFNILLRVFMIVGGFDLHIVRNDNIRSCVFRKFKIFDKSFFACQGISLMNHFASQSMNLPTTSWKSLYIESWEILWLENSKFAEHLTMSSCSLMETCFFITLPWCSYNLSFISLSSSQDRHSYGYIWSYSGSRNSDNLVQAVNVPLENESSILTNKWWKKHAMI